MNYLVTCRRRLYSVISNGSFNQNLDIVGDLGEGSFGKVYRARNKLTGVDRAVKIIQKDHDDPFQTEAVRNEIHSLMDLDHPNIVKLISFFEEKDEFRLVFEVCEGPDLFDRIVSETDIMTEIQCAIALRHMMKAVRACHDRFVGHYDIKPENFMYIEADCRHLKMIDFGLSSPFKKDSTEVKGTTDYMAPEITRGCYGPESDVWSCGIVFFIMLTGNSFIDSDLPESTKIAKIRDRHFVEDRIQFAESNGVSPAACALLRRMLSHDRHLRCTAADVLKDPFIQQSYFPDHYHPEFRAEADKIIAGSLDNFRIFVKEPILKKTAFMVLAHCYGECLGSHRLAFSTLDRMVGSGELSAEATEAYFKSMDLPMPDGMDDLFSQLSLENNGYVGFDTFAAANLPLSGRFYERFCRQVFAKLDSNGDDRIDVEDLLHVVRAEGFSNVADHRRAHAICSLSLKELGFGRSVKFEPFFEMMKSGPGALLPPRPA